MYMYGKVLSTCLQGLPKGHGVAAMYLSVCVHVYVHACVCTLTLTDHHPSCQIWDIRKKTAVQTLNSTYQVQEEYCGVGTISSTRSRVSYRNLFWGGGGGGLCEW